MPNVRKGQALVVVAVLLVSAGAAYAQFGLRSSGSRNAAARFPPELREDRAFSFCRILYTSVRRERSGGGWRTDYPYGEINLMIRLSELTKTPVPFDREREPTHYVVRLTDPSLFECPLTMASDVGTIGLSAAEAEHLRLYIAQGRVPVGGRFLGDGGVAAVDARDGEGAPAIGVPHHGRPP